MKLKHKDIVTLRLFLLSRQQGLCSLCGDLIEDDAVLDHDHKTGRIRSVLNNLNDAKRKFRYQRSKARSRGIDWCLTFEQWYQWWQDSDHWHERGITSGKYVMSRFGDVGPYSLDNIFCQTRDDNCREAIHKITGIKRSEQFCKNLSDKLKGVPKPYQQGTLNRFHKDNLTDELKEKIKQGREKTKKPVVTPFGRFPSVTEAAQALKVDKGTIGYRIKAHPKQYYYEIKT
jgi:hypothetical protein